MACTGAMKKYSSVFQSAIYNLQSKILQCRISFLENGQIVIRDLQDNAGHGRAVIVAEAMVSPRARVAIPIDAVEQLVADGGIPLGPILAAGRPHGLGGVIVAVVIMEVNVGPHGSVAG